MTAIDCMEAVISMTGLLKHQSVGCTCSSSWRSSLQNVLQIADIDVFNCWKRLMKEDEWESDDEFARHLLRLYSAWRTGNCGFKGEKKHVEKNKMPQKVTESRVINDRVSSDLSNSPDFSVIEDTSSCSWGNHSQNTLVTKLRTSSEQGNPPNVSPLDKSISSQEQNSQECIIIRKICSKQDDQSDCIIVDKPRSAQHNMNRLDCYSAEKTVSFHPSVPPNSLDTVQKTSSQLTELPKCSVTHGTRRKPHYETSTQEGAGTSKVGLNKKVIPIQGTYSRKQKTPRKRNQNKFGCFGSSAVNAKDVFLSEYILTEAIEVPRPSSHGEELNSSEENTLVQHKAKSNLFPCPLCGTNFTLEQNLEQHMPVHGMSLAEYTKQLIENGNLVEERPEWYRTIYICKGCERHFRHRYNIVKHLKHGKPLACRRCHKVFACKTALSTHHSNVHVRSKHPKCDICDKHFHGGIALRAHTWTHIADCQNIKNIAGNEATVSAEPDNSLQLKEMQEFPCKMCGIKFSNVSNLKLHVRIHSDSNNDDVTSDSSR